MVANHHRSALAKNELLCPALPNRSAEITGIAMSHCSATHLLPILTGASILGLRTTEALLLPVLLLDPTPRSNFGGHEAMRHHCHPVARQARLFARGRWKMARGGDAENGQKKVEGGSGSGITGRAEMGAEPSVEAVRRARAATR